MSTSGSTNFTVTRDQIIAAAYRKLGVIGFDQTPSADQVTVAAESLNMMVKSLINKGMPLWALSQFSFPTVASTATYTIGLGQTLNTAKPLKIIQAWYRNSSNNDVPMTVITREEYNRLGNKTSLGTPIQLYYDPQRDTGTIFLFPTPQDASVTIFFRYQRPFEDFDLSTDNPDFPQEWYEVLVYQLATRLAPDVGLPVQDRQMLKQEAKDILQDALDFGVEEGSFYFEVDRRNW